LLRKPNHRETERSGEGKASGAQKQRAAYEPTTTTKTPPAIWTTVMLRASAAQRTTNLQFYITVTRFGLLRKEIGKNSRERLKREKQGPFIST
jgi:hypothetical protein